MSLIRITNFGGLVPRAQPRALPDDAAQVADNLLPTTREFRPLAADTTVLAASGVTDPKTIFRLQRNADGTFNTVVSSAGNWKVYTGEVSLVKGQVNDDTTDRHYLTYDDGSAPPRVIDATGMNRQLGVPAPTEPPGAEVNSVEQFSVDDRNAAIQTALQQARDAITDNLLQAYIGADRPGTGVDGLMDRTGAAFTEQPNQQVRVYRATSTGGAHSGALEDAFSPVATDQFSWVFDPALNGFWMTSITGHPAWALPAGRDHWCIGVPSYASTYTLDSVAMKADLMAIDRPGGTAGVDKLLTEAQADAVILKLDAMVDPSGPVLLPKLQALQAKHEEVLLLLEGGAAAALISQMAAFYAKVDVAAEIAATIANWAREIFLKAKYVATTGTTVYVQPDSGPGNGADY